MTTYKKQAKNPRTDLLDSLGSVANMTGLKQSDPIGTYDKAVENYRNKVQKRGTASAKQQLGGSMGQNELYWAKKGAQEAEKKVKQLEKYKDEYDKQQQDAKNRQSLVNLKNAVTSKLPQVPEDLQLYGQGVMNAAKGAYNVERQNQGIREVMQAYNNLAEINNIYADLNTGKTRLWGNQDISMKRFQDAAKNYQEILRKNKSNLPDNLVQQLSSAVPYQIVNTSTRDYYPAINYNILDNGKQYFTNSLQDLGTNMNAYKNAKQNFQQNSNIYNSNPSVETLQNKDESRNNLAKARRNLGKLGL